MRERRGIKFKCRQVKDLPKAIEEERQGGIESKKVNSSDEHTCCSV